MADPLLDTGLHIDLSGAGFNPIEQGVDYVFDIAFGLDNPLQITDKFSMPFRETLNGAVLGELKAKQFVIDALARKVTIIVDGAITQQWFVGEAVTAANRVRLVYGKLRHTDSVGNDRLDTSGLNCKFNLKIGLLRDGS